LEWWSKNREKLAFAIQSSGKTVGTWGRPRRASRHCYSQKTYVQSNASWLNAGPSTRADRRVRILHEFGRARGRGGPRRTIKGAIREGMDRWDRRDRGEFEGALRGKRSEADHRANRGLDRTQRGYESDAELIAFAKNMKARQYARLLDYEDEESGLRIKRLWSFTTPNSADASTPTSSSCPTTPTTPRHSTRTSSNNSARSAAHGRLLRRTAVLRLIRRRDR